jgi:hypothetical protein
VGYWEGMDGVDCTCKIVRAVESNGVDSLVRLGFCLGQCEVGES